MKKISERELRWLDEHDLKGRSPLYKFIRENFAKLKARKAGDDDGPSWARLAEWLARQGQTNSRGEPLSWDAVRKVFTRVSRDIEAEDRQRRTGVAVKKAPTRAPSGWRPPVVERGPQPIPPPARHVSPFAPAPVSPESGTSDDISPEQLRAGLAEVIAKRSGR